MCNSTRENTLEQPWPQSIEALSQDIGEVVNENENRMDEDGPIYPVESSSVSTENCTGYVPVTQQAHGEVAGDGHRTEEVTATAFKVTESRGMECRDRGQRS